METYELDTKNPVGRRETPTAYLVTPSTATRPEWLEARRSGITATDLPAILGLSNYRTAIDVWNDKTMPPAEDDPNLAEAAIWGNRLEEPVAQEWAERAGVKIRRVGLVSNVDEPWMMASLDRIVTGCAHGRCALEVKTRSLYVAETWEKGVPEDVRAQVMWQLAVTGLDHIHVAALIGGQRLVTHNIEPDLAEMGRLRDAARLIWDAVSAGEFPELPEEFWTAAYVEQRHASREGQVEVTDRETILGLIHEYQRLAGDEKQCAEWKAGVRTRLVGLLGDAEAATIDGKVVYSYKHTTRRSLDPKRLAEIYPDVAADDRIYTTTASRTLRVNSKETK